MGPGGAFPWGWHYNFFFFFFFLFSSRDTKTENIDLILKRIETRESKTACEPGCPGAGGGLEQAPHGHPAGAAQLLVPEHMWCPNHLGAEFIKLHL